MPSFNWSLYITQKSMFEYCVRKMDPIQFEVNTRNALTINYQSAREQKLEMAPFEEREM